MREGAARALFAAAAGASILAVALICAFLFVNGVPAMAQIGLPEFLFGTTWRPASDVYGIFPMIVGSVYVTAGAILVGVPCGLLCAIFLSRFASGRVAAALKPGVELLAGIPSVVYGFFGLVVIVPFIRNTMPGRGLSLLAAAVLLGIMILPTVITVAQSALDAVPRAYYEGALALGADHERAVFRIVVPAAASGIMAGVVLGTGRAIGETMAVIMVAGNQAVIPESVFDGVRTLTANIVLEMGYAADLHRGALVATGVVLFVFILLITVLFNMLKRPRPARRAASRRGEALRLAAGRPKAGNRGGEDASAAPPAALPSSGGRLDALCPAEAGRMARARRAQGRALRGIVYLGAAMTATVLAFLVGYILVNGVPYLTPSLFAWEYTSDNVSLMPALVNTLLMAALALLIAVPTGVGSAIYLVEYAPRGSRFVAAVRMTAETLQGIPSIIYGLFGLLFFVTALHWGLSLLSGACTLAIMVLPVVMRTTEETLIAVPDAYREGGFGLGAGRLRTVFRCVLPSALPGILGGVILALGRCVGEVAALIFTAGSIAQVPNIAGEGVFAVFDSTRTLAVHMYVLASEGLHMNETYATAVVLLVVVAALNLAATFASRRVARPS